MVFLSDFGIMRETENFGVPPFIATGEKIVVGTEEANYVERAK